MSHMIRRSLGSAGGSIPPSESSDGASSEHNEHIMNTNWLRSSAAQQLANNFNSIHSDVDKPSNTSLSDYERNRVESFFAGLDTEIFVSPSLANLYESTGKVDWKIVYTGIPVLVYDKGNARARSIPRVTLLLAERGSSFVLWSDQIEYLSNYHVFGPYFHTIRSHTNHQHFIGLSFDSTESARELWHQIGRLVSDPKDIATSRKNQKQKRVKPALLPLKAQISHPCQFQHVTSMKKEDIELYYSMKTFAHSLNHNQESS